MSEDNRAQAKLASKLGQSALVRPDANGKLVYTSYSDQGDVIPDFSTCGYRRGSRIPDVPEISRLHPTLDHSDDTTRIQDAIDNLSRLPVGADGFRGALLLCRGSYRIGGMIHIHTSGIVLRGEGQRASDTVLIATGTQKRSLIHIVGSGSAVPAPVTQQRIVTDYVPVGSNEFAVADASRFRPGDSVIVSRIGNAAWIREIGMDRIARRRTNPASTRQWEPFSLDFDRVVTGIEGSRVTIDAPITCAIDARWGSGQISMYDDSARLENIGVENLRGISDFDRRVRQRSGNQEYCSDEEHASYLVEFQNVKNAWIRNVTAEHFRQGLALLGTGAKWITVQDSANLNPVSVLTGDRRYAFHIRGAQLCLIVRCFSHGARHAFSIGPRVAGPNAFVYCCSEDDHGCSEAHERWSTGCLYDNVKARIAVQDRQWMGSGHGWGGANYVIWNCEGSLICQQPPTAQNFAIGFVGKSMRAAFRRPRGWWESAGQHVEPQSLYFRQLEDRVGTEGMPELLGC